MGFDPAAAFPTLPSLRQSVAGPFHSPDASADVLQTEPEDGSFHGICGLARKMRDAPLDKGKSVRRHGFTEHQARCKLQS